MLGSRWHEVNFEKRTAHIPITKNGTSRTVPPSTEALEILRSLPRSLDGQVFPINGPNLSVIFDKARRIAEVDDFHFHDLRHMAITSIAEKLPNLIELSAAQKACSY